MPSWAGLFDVQRKCATHFGGAARSGDRPRREMVVLGADEPLKGIRATLYHKMKERQAGFHSRAWYTASVSDAARFHEKWAACIRPCRCISACKDGSLSTCRTASWM